MDLSFGPKPLVSFTFEVERITDMSDDGRYQVQWAPAWVSELNLVGCEHLIQEFLQMKLEKESRENFPRASSDESDIYHLQEPEQFTLYEKETIIEDRGVDTIVKHPQDDMIQLEDKPEENGESNFKKLTEIDKRIDQLLASWVDGSKLIGFGNCLHESQGLQSETQNADWQENGQDTNESTGPRNHMSNSQTDGSQISRFDIHLQGLPFDPCNDSVATPSVPVNISTTEKVLEDHSSAQSTTAEQPEEHSVIDDSSTQYISDSIELGPAKVMARCDQKRGRNGDNGRKELSRFSTRKSKKPVCTVCKKKFRWPSQLAVHLRSHTGEQPFKCPQCQKSFSTKGNLKQHLRLHAGLKPFSCKLCDKAFAEKANLQRHQLLHAGERPHQCNECDQRFTEKSHLVVHIRRAHTGVKPFQCDLCGKKFVTTSDLKRHSHDHSGEKPFECSLCGKGYAFQLSLKSHLFSHSKEKQYPCTYNNCKMRFARMEYLKRHMRAHTSE